MKEITVKKCILKLDKLKLFLEDKENIIYAIAIAFIGVCVLNLLYTQLQFPFFAFDDIFILKLIMIKYVQKGDGLII